MAEIHKIIRNQFSVERKKKTEQKKTDLSNGPTYSHRKKFPALKSSETSTSNTFLVL